MRLDAPWLRNAGPRAVVDALEAAGHRALFVGGAVRNTLMGLAPGDIDIATDARPERVTELTEAAGMRAVPTGFDHGTVTVVVDHHGFEVTTFRRDVETDGRRAIVAYSTDVAEDAARRDFTMNAIYATAEGEIVDPLHGLPDLLARRVRFVGDPEARIREDYLRILRFFRFQAWYGEDGPDPEGLAACAALSAGIDTLSRERIGAEAKKLLSAPDPAPALAAMSATGVLARVLPGAEHQVLAPLIHLELQAGLGPDPIRRLAALGGEGVAERLRLSRDEARRLETICAATSASAGAAELGYRHGADTAISAIALRHAALGAPFPVDATAEASRGAAARFPVRAGDLSPPLVGRALGVRLRTLEDRWIESGFRLSRDELLR